MDRSGSTTKPGGGCREVLNLGTVLLRLRFPPTPEHMADHAAVAVEAAAGVEGVALNYEVSSLASLDAILEQFHDDATDPDSIASTLFTFGAYIGEVIVREASGSWTMVEPGHPLDGGWPIIELPGGRLVNPVGKAFKRVRNGEVDSIPYFYRALVQE